MKPLPGHLLFRLYQVFVLPIFDYCVVWAPTSITLAKPLERLHSRFLQQVPVSNSAFVKVTLTERRHFHIAVQVFKILHQFCPRYLKDWFVSAEAYTGRSGRNKFWLFVPRINTSISKNGFFIVEL